jgi:hypothetical protein
VYLFKVLLLIIFLCPPNLVIDPEKRLLQTDQSARNLSLEKELALQQGGPLFDQFSEQELLEKGPALFRQRTTQEAAFRSFDEEGVAVLVVKPNVLLRTSDNGGFQGGPTYRFFSSSALREFYRTHGDDYDSVLFFLHEELDDPGAFARGGSTNTRVQGVGDFRGVGDKVIDDNPLSGSRGRLQGSAIMNCICFIGDNPYIDRFEVIGREPIGYTMMDLMVQEWGHRQLSYPFVRDPDGELSSGLLGRGLAHWNFFSDTGGSPLEGSNLEEILPNLFESAPTPRSLSDLDLYLLGYLTASQTKPFFYVDKISETGDIIHEVDSRPSIGPIFSGRRRDVTIEDVIAVMGPRIPAPNEGPAPVSERHAFVLVIPEDVEVDPVKIAQLDNFRRAWQEHFTVITQGRAVVDTRLVPREVDSLPPVGTFLFNQSGKQGETVEADALVLHAENLASVEVLGGGVEVELLSTEGETARMSISISPFAAPGPRSVLFRGVDGQEQIAKDFFHVSPLNGKPLPYVTGSRADGQFNAGLPPGTQDAGYTFFGRFFQQGLTLEATGEGVTFSETEVGGSIRTNISVAEDAPTGFRDIIVRNPDGGTEVLSRILPIVKGPAPGPFDLNDPSLRPTEFQGGLGCAVSLQSKGSSWSLVLLLSALLGLLYTKRKFLS